MSQPTAISDHAAADRALGLDREILVLGGVVVLGTVMAILDATIVNVAIPTLARDFGASISTIQWVMTGYLLAFASVIPLTGWATDRFGAKRVWIAALLVFMTGSALAGAAWSIEALIAFRVVQGFGGGLLMPVGQTLLARAAGPKRMGRVMSVVGVPMLLAPIFGPVVGGAIVDTVSWRWIFFVNLPIGALAVLLALRVLPAVGGRHGQRLDLPGLLLLSPGIAAFVYGMSEVGAAGGLDNSRALAAVAAGLVLVALFVRRALSLRHEALIDITLFARRGFAAAAGTNLLLGIALFGALILLPLYYQLVRGESPLATGLLLVPQGLGAALAMPIAGRLTDEIGARLVIPVGVVLALVGTLGYTQVSADTSYWLLAAALFAIGLGLGSTIMPSMAIAYQAVSREEMPHATSVVNVVQRVAGAIGSALLAITLQRSIEAELPSLSEGIQGIATVPAERRDEIAPDLAAAFGTTFWIAAALVGAALVAALLLPGSPRSARAAETTSEAQAGRRAA